MIGFTMQSKTLQSRSLRPKILSCRLVSAGHSLFNLQRVDFITLLSLSPRHNWSGNILLFRLLESLFFRALSFPLVRLLKHRSRYITTLVIIVIFVLVASTGPGSNSRLVLNPPVWIWQHKSWPLHVSNNDRVDGGAHTIIRSII